MIITVKQGEPVQIPDVARAAMVQVKGDKAQVAILPENFTGPQRLIGTEIPMLGERWLVTGQAATGHVHTLTCRRITDG